MTYNLIIMLFSLKKLDKFAKLVSK